MSDGGIQTLPVRLDNISKKKLWSLEDFTHQLKSLTHLNQAGPERLAVKKDVTAFTQDQICVEWHYVRQDASGKIRPLSKLIKIGAMCCPMRGSDLRPRTRYSVMVISLPSQSLRKDDNVSRQKEMEL